MSSSENSDSSISSNCSYCDDDGEGEDDPNQRPDPEPFPGVVIHGSVYPPIIKPKPPNNKPSAPLSSQQLEKWKNDFYQNPKNVLALNVCTRNDPVEVCLSRKSLEKISHVFTYKIENEGKPITNQKGSGRCWLFAALNAIRIPFMKLHNLEEFEFSQGHLFYWDKIERSHYFLNNVVKILQRNEKPDGRLMSFLLNDPIIDGGQWDMFVNLVMKYGLMPKKCFPETFCCESSSRMNILLQTKLREYTKILTYMYSRNSTEDLYEKIKEQMAEIYKIVGICLGIPPETFKWEYYDKNKAYQSIGPITPLDFYNNYVKSCFNVENKVCLVTDPRSTNPYGKAYSVDCLGNVVGGRPVIYNNQPVEILMNLVTTSIKNGEPVWFGCEVGKRYVAKNGVEDLEIHDYKLVFDTDFQISLDKADRLIYGDSAMSHAMVFTAVAVENDEPTKFRVENSWGEDRGEKGYLLMTKDWFKEFVFEIVVDKSIVPIDIMNVFKMDPIILPAWDPMGALAK